MGKHAYLIVANSNFKVLELCLKMLNDARNDIYVLFDKKAKVSSDYLSKISSPTTLYPPPRVYQEFPINWAGYSQVKAVLFLMKEALASGAEYEYLHFLQGSDLPIKTQDEIHSFFREEAGMQFVNVDFNRKYMADNKCHYRHFFCHNRFFRKHKLMKMLNFVFVKIQRLLGIKKNTDIELFQGSALFSITQDCAAYILSREEEIYKRFHHSLAADEVFIQTVLMDSPYRGKIKDIDSEYSSFARLIDRTRPDGKNAPHIWRSEEFEKIITQPSNLCFARKFDESADFEIAKKLCDYLTPKTVNE